MIRIVRRGKFVFPIVCGLSMLFMIPASIAQELSPSQTNLSVLLSVVVERSADGFNYLYTLRNDASSGQTVYTIAIDNRADPGTIRTPQTWRSGSYNKGRDANQFAIWFPGSNRPGNQALEQAPINSIGPGGVSDIFGILAVRGLPSVVEWRVEGWTPVPELDEGSGNVIYNGVEYTQDQLEDTDFVNELIKKKIFTTDTENVLRGSTLGPATPPSEQKIICDTFILDLLGQVREAAALGWIKHDLRKDDDNRGKGKGDDKGMKKGQDDDRRDGGNPAKSMDGRERDDGDDHADDDVEMGEKDKGLPGVAKSIIKKLTKVRRECLRGKFGSAREKLRALIKQVNAQRGKHLTEEAYALIKFNAEFLLEKL